ncbi:MAG TPA: hypothetical protein VJC03_08695, partial [bacterium]|nr:hypothetical protein [bacterium]
MVPFRRKIFLVNKPYQFRYFLFIAVFILALFAAVSISSYLLIHPLLFHQFLGAITKKQTSIFAFKLIGCYGLETLLLLG